jgi:hypothetical protein
VAGGIGGVELWKLERKRRWKLEGNHWRGRRRSRDERAAGGRHKKEEAWGGGRAILFWLDSPITRPVTR